MISVWYILLRLKVYTINIANSSNIWEIQRRYSELRDFKNEVILLLILGRSVNT